MMCLIERGVQQLSHNIERSSIFIKYWWVNDVCPIRILLIEVNIFLVMSGEGQTMMMFLISFGLAEHYVQARSHMLFEINLITDLASCKVKQLSFMASEEVNACRASFFIGCFVSHDLVCE